MKKSPEPSKASLRDMPEIDFATAKRLRRGEYLDRARRSFALALIDPELFAHFGSSEAIATALRAVVEASTAVRTPTPSKRRKSATKTSRKAAA